MTTASAAAAPPAASIALSEQPPVPPPGPFIGIGEAAIAWWTDGLRTLQFVGELFQSFGRLLMGRSLMSRSDLLWQLAEAGPRSLPIVSLVSAMSGLILGYMGAAQLQRFGAQSFIADLVTVGAVREMAALMTGVILAGRIGAAYAAQIGSMQANEEIDALRALGVEPMDQLVLPRVLAMLLAAPLLISYAALVTMAAGGAVAVLVFDVPPREYLAESIEALTMPHLLIGLLKGTVYALLVALAGCRQGLDAGRSAQAVGEATTTAVVKSIVWMVAAASALTVRLSKTWLVTASPASATAFTGRRDIAPNATATPSPAAAPGAPLVRVERLTMAFGDTLIQRDLNFDVRSGEVFIIMGRSGCGKSTLMRHLVGLQAPAEGRVLYGDVDLNAADDATQAGIRRLFGVMFQSGALWSSMTVGENLMLPMTLFTSLRPAEREARAREKLQLVDLADQFDALPSALSGGMKKRAAIARALALEPPLLYLDEPSAGLDPPTAARLDQQILQLREQLGTTVVIVTHDLDSIFAVADRALFLDADEKTMTALGPPRELLEDGPAAAQALLRREQR